MGEALQLQTLQLRQGNYNKESSVNHKRKAKMKWILMASFLISMGYAGTIDPATVTYISTSSRPGTTERADTTKRPEPTTQFATTKRPNTPTLPSMYDIFDVPNYVGGPFEPIVDPFDPFGLFKPPIGGPYVVPTPYGPLQYGLPPIVPPNLAGPPLYGPIYYGPPYYGPPQY